MLDHLSTLVSERFKAKSTTAQTHMMQEFIADFFREGPETAYNNLRKGNPEGKTIDCAQDFLKEVQAVYDFAIRKRLKDLTGNASASQVRIMQNFFDNYKKTNDFQFAHQSSIKLIEKDPELSKDIKFKQFFKDISDKAKPQEKEGVVGLSINQDDGLLFSATNKPQRKYELPLDAFQTKKLIENTFKSIHLNSLPENERGKVSNMNFELDVNSVFYDKQISLASRLAFKDVQRATGIATQEIQKGRMNQVQLIKLRERIEKIDELRETNYLGSVFNYNDKSVTYAIKEANINFEKKPPFVFTEQVDIIRDMIMDVTYRKTPVDFAFKTALEKTNGIPGSEKLQNILNEFSKTIPAANNRKSLSAILLEAYSLYIDINKKDHTKDVMREVTLLSKGIKNANTQQSLRETRDKYLAAVQAKVINTFYDDVLAKGKKIVQTKGKFDATKDVADIAAKTNNPIKIQNERSAIDPNKGKGMSQGFSIN